MHNHTAKMNLYLKAFLLSVLTAAIFILPYVFTGKGILYIFTDFNLQQIPFNMLSNQAIKSGDIWWNWNTDLGSSFIGAYSFYTLGSPFFWLSMLFSPNMFPYLSAVLLILKYGLAGLCAFAYIHRHVKNANFAVIGSLLYAFSGFQIGNMFYNHFLDVTALFPLLLIALDELMENDRKIIFAIIVAVSILTNYYFFVGEAVFLAIYFVCRLATKQYKPTGKTMMRLVAEGLLGVGISAILLLPSLLYTMQIPRAESKITGIKALLYHPSVYLDILRAFLMPPEAATRSMITATSWSSTEAFLPIFGIVLVLAYILARKRDWLSVTIITGLIFAFIPILNSLFYALNSEYYSRWFYMLVLLMATASAKALEEEISLKKGIAATICIWVVFLLGLAVANRKQPVILNKGYLIFFAALLAVSAACFVFIMYFRQKPYFFHVVLVSLVVLVSVSGMFTLWANRKTFPSSSEFTKVFLDEGKNIQLNDSSTYRVDTTNCYFNFNLILNKPSINSFSSTVEGSISAFYKALGIDRVNMSNPDYAQYGLRDLLSAKYVIALNKTLPMVTYQDIGKMPGLEKYKTQGDYDVFYNQDYIPFGFTFGDSITEQKLSTVPANNRHLVLLKALELTPAQAAKYQGLLPEISDGRMSDFSASAYKADVASRKKQTCYSFRRTNAGFDAKIKLDKANLVFFSVPYDRGWRATVNGKPALIEKVDAGLMAVKADAGDNTIAFDFKPQGFRTGAAISAVSVVLLILYAGFILYRIKRAQRV